MDLFSDLAPEYFFCPLRNKGSVQGPKGQTHPISLSRHTPGSAMLRRVLDQPSAELK
jgi:hypothetical protein